MSDERIRDLEEQIAHLSKAVDDLSDVVLRQGAEIDVLTRRMRLVMERLAEAELDNGGTAPLADQKPPHW
ncbi:MAG: SlyX family protein [Rhodobacteraceae bacterium]|nr:SlyX family protein [Paracoccaceae bacterium]MCB1366554.1 SlyX family protein [Paracoccaceae bacterium]